MAAGEAAHAAWLERQLSRGGNRNRADHGMTGTGEASSPSPLRSPAPPKAIPSRSDAAMGTPRHSVWLNAQLRQAPTHHKLSRGTPDHYRWSPSQPLHGRSTVSSAPDELSAQVQHASGRFAAVESFARTASAVLPDRDLATGSRAEWLSRQLAQVEHSAWLSRQLERVEGAVPSSSGSSGSAQRRAAAGSGHTTVPGPTRAVEVCAREDYALGSQLHSQWLEQQLAGRRSLR